MRRGTNTDCVLLSFRPQASKAWRWHARSYFYRAFYSHPHILLYLSSCLFRRRSLDHSNIIEGGKSSLFCSVSFWAQIGEMKFNLFFHDSIFFLTHLFSSTDIPFQLTSYMSSGSGAADRRASRPSSGEVPAEHNAIAPGANASAVRLIDYVGNDFVFLLF